MPTRSAVSFLSRARVPLPLCPFVSLPSANATIASGLSAAMPAQEQNYWLETINAPSVEAAPDLPENVDVAIVGGGFCGLSAARALAKRGVRAAVLEAETFGWGASCRNGGMVLTGMKLPVPKLIKRYGRPTVRKMYAASIEAVDLVEQIVREENIECNFSRCGHLEVACKPSHFNGFEESAALIEREFRHQLRIVPQGDLRSEIGSHIYFGGMVDETSAGVNPAREVILASGAYTTETTPALRKKIIPIGSYIIATEVLPADLAHELSPRNRMIYDSKHFLYYYRLTPDNRMLFGGRAAFFPATESTVRQSAEILRRGMITVYPQLCDTKIEYGWGGTLDFTLDVMPHAGKMDEMYFAVGFAGHGVAAATWFGTKLAEMISGNINSIPFAELPFPAAPIGLRSGRTWALPLAGLWYRILDFFT